VPTAATPSSSIARRSWHANRSSPPRPSAACSSPTKRKSTIGGSAGRSSQLRASSACVSNALEHDARRVRGVRIPTGFASATTVVNAAGAWAGALDGVPEHARIEIRAVAGEMLALAVPAGALRALIWRGNRYLVPRGDARVLVGATVEERGEDARVTAAGMHDLLDFALGVAPALRSFAVVETWAGLRPASPDGLPYLGATALDGYVVAAGHYRNGILLTPLTGRLIAQLIVDGSATGLEPFSPLRVREAQRVGANRSA
jgi:glycine oxidase